MFLRVFSPTGDTLLSRQFGTQMNELLVGVMVDDAGDIILVGTTTGALIGQGTGSSDAFLRIYGSDGTVKLTRQFGTSTDESVDDVFVSGENVYIVGTTEGGLIGSGTTGGKDVCLRVYDRAGSNLLTRQIGTTENDTNARVVVNNTGEIFVAGILMARS